MKYGARNQLMGTVTDIKKGSVMCEVKVKIASGAFMESVMTMNSLKELGHQERRHGKDRGQGGECFTGEGISPDGYRYNQGYQQTLAPGVSGHCQTNCRVLH